MFYVVSAVAHGYPLQRVQAITGIHVRRFARFDVGRNEPFQLLCR